MLPPRPRSLRQLLGLLTLALAIPMLLAILAVGGLQVQAERLRLESLARAEARSVLLQADRLIAGHLVALRRRAAAEAGPATAPAGWPPLEGLHLALLDRTGATLRDTRPAGAGLPEAARDAALVLAASGVLVSPLVEDAASGGHALLLAEAVPEGVLVLALPAARFRDLMRDGTEGAFDPTRFPALADAEGRIVARWQEHEAFVGRPMPPAARAALLAEPEATWHGRNLDGEPVVVVHAASALSGLVVGVGITEAALRKPLRRSAAVLGPGVVVLLVLAALATLAVARRISRPVASLGAAAASLADGQPPPRLRTGIAEVDAVAAAMADAAERRRAAEVQRDLLVRELHHRVKNVLATAQSLASLSARSASDPMGFANQFGDRLRALARTHTLLLEEPGGALALRTLLTEVVAPYRLGLGRITMEGPEVRLEADAAVPLGMVLHELATNAAKYGALSSAEGRLTVAWRVDPATPRPLLTLEWAERGGPPVAGPPQRRGFGSQLLQRAMASMPGGTAETAWEPEGLSVRLTLRFRQAAP